MKKNISQNMVFNIIYVGLNTGYPLIAAMYVARVLTPEYVGRITYAQNIVTYFITFAALGIPQYGMREIARCKGNSNLESKTFSELFFINLISTILFSILYVLVVLVVPRFHEQSALYFTVGLQLFANVFNVDWYFTGREEYDYITKRNVKIKSICIVLLFWVVRNENDYLLYALIYCFASFGNYLLNIAGLKKRVHIVRRGLSLNQHMSSVLILLLSVVANDIYTQVDTTMIGIIGTEGDVAYYNYAIKISRNITMVTAAISTTILPRCSVLFRENKQNEFSKLVSVTAELILLVASPLMTGMLVVPRAIIGSLFGEEYMASVSVLRIVAPIVLVVSVCCICGQVVLLSVKGERYQLYAMGISCAVNIILNSLMIPQWGISGAAIASLISEITALVIYLHFALRYYTIMLSKNCFMSLIVANLALAVVARSTTQVTEGYFRQLLLACVLGGGTYFIVLIVLKNNAMIRILEKILEKARTRKDQ